MEIFERMAWYGWFTVMAVYVTGSVATGGLGFSTELAGALQGIVPFFLYLLPVVTGALADRYGYKKMFIIAYLVMMVSYYLLGQFHTVPTFFMAFMFVAVGAAIFKPVVVGTVARTTNESNSATGFGIFYMMVNVGGFAGPIVAGLVRGKGWEYVFMACSAWSALNLLIVLFFYKEPAVPGAEQEKRSLRQVGDNMVEVLGNMRFFITVFTVVFALMFANLNVWWFAHFTWTLPVLHPWLAGIEFCLGHDLAARQRRPGPARLEGENLSVQEDALQ
ncbi:MAG: MFS transporter [Planctomycetes bacterium]|nr:MFS transporter [Planctomycetota bacterium]